MRSESVVIQARRAALAGTLTLPPDAPARLVVLSHGLCSDSSVFADFPAALAQRGAAVLAFDYSGHGKSAGGRGLITAASHRTETHAVAHWLRSRFPGPPLLLVGHSFGAHAALVGASTLRGLVHGVAVISAPLRSGDALPPWKRTAMRASGRALRLLGPLAPPVKITYGGSDAWSGGLLDVRTLAYAATVDNVSAAARVAYSQTALVVRGALDAQVTAAAASTLLDAFKSRQKMRLDLPGSSHSPFTGPDLNLLADAVSRLG